MSEVEDFTPTEDDLSQFMVASTVAAALCSSDEVWLGAVVFLVGALVAGLAGCWAVPVAHNRLIITKVDSRYLVRMNAERISHPRAVGCPAFHAACIVAF